MFLGFLINGCTPSQKTTPLTNASPLADYFQEKANVVDPIIGHQKGRVQLHGVYWFARLSDPTAKLVEPGVTVTIVGRESNTLVVVL